MKIYRIITVVCLLCLSCLTITAQALRVKSFECLTSDLAALTKKRLDFNENPCAILRISIPNSNDFVFEGNIVGAPEYTPGEILLWMTKGTKNITIKSEKTGSLKFDFPDKLESKMVYKLTLYIPGTQILRLDFSPEDAKVYIDNKPQIALNGSLTLALNQGKHHYRIEHKYYHTEEGDFAIENGEATILTKVLKPNFGVVKVTSEQNANITIDNQNYKNIQSISDTLLTGTHSIIAQKNQIKKKINVQMGEGKTQNIQINYRPDIFILGTYTLSRDQLGGTIGFCKKNGGYLSARTGEFSTWQYNGDHTSIKGFGGGYLRKINNWLYFQGGLGYIYLDNQNAYDRAKYQTTQIEGGVLCRIGKHLICSILYTSWLDDEKFTTATIGLGIAL